MIFPLITSTIPNVGKEVGEMRHLERELKDQETIRAFLNHSLIARMATVNRKGIPVIKPVNYLYWEGKIYIHSSKKGEKTDDIRRGSPVCFEVDQAIAYVPAKRYACEANYYYRSVIINGKATFVNERSKKNRILQKLIEKYQPGWEGEKVPEEILEKTAVIEILPRHITGRENL